MMRHVAAVAVVVCLSPAWLSAQTTRFTVSAASATVHKSPSTGSPVVGKAGRGMVLVVTRELGSWVRVTWPTAEDGVAYVHVTMGSIARGSTPDASRVAGSPATSPRTAPEPSSATNARVESPRASQPPASTRRVPAPTRPVYVTPTTHIVGLGGRMSGSTTGLGASVRVWGRDRIGIQFTVARSELTSSVGPERLASMNIEPSVLYSLPDHVGDYVWLRPYLGSGASLRRQTFSSGLPGVLDSRSDTGFGVQAFGGGEFTFSSVPRFALSADLSYHWLRTPVTGFELDGLGVSVSGHWYVK